MRQQIGEPDGPSKLEAFLDHHKIPVKEAARQLKVSHASVFDWLAGRRSPSTRWRQRIAVWTRDEVPELSWMTASERRELQKQRPFDATGTS